VNKFRKTRGLPFPVNERPLRETQTAQRRIVAFAFNVDNFGADIAV
jgi:hypothetical protein